MDNKLLNQNTILFDKLKEFSNSFNAQISPRINVISDSVPDVFDDYDYPICSWPVIINKNNLEKIKKVTTLIPKLLREIPKLYFDNDISKIAKFYFEGDESLAQFSMMCHDKNLEVSCRLDLILEAGEFKVLEVNMGSSIGGLEVQNLEPIIKDMHPQVASMNLTSRPIHTKFLKFLVAKIIEYVPIEDEINIFFVTDTSNDPDNERVKNFIQELLNKELIENNKKGEVFAGNIAELEFLKNKLRYKDKVIHSALIFNTLGDTITPSLFRAMVMDKAYFPDHLGTYLLEDKRNLVLLRRLAEQKKFSPEDCAYLLNCIPWSELVEDRMTRYKNEQRNVLDILKSEKDNFVIKIADGFQGDDVFVGKYITPDDWDKVISDALKSGKFIAQEFCESVELLAPDTSNTWLPHQLIWGGFGFGDEYGGTFVRMIANKNNTGAINTAAGATEALVYEEF